MARLPRTLRRRLQAAFLTLGLAAIGVTGWQASSVASGALEREAYDRLTAVRETKRRQITDYLRDLRNHVLALAGDESSIAALEWLRAAWGTLPEGEGAAGESRLRGFYEQTLAPKVARDVGAAELMQRWYPRDGRQRWLQEEFIARNPHPVGSKDLLLRPGARGAYADAHARYHPTLHHYQTAFGFYDIFLIGRDGRVLYTVFKEIDLGADLSAAPWRETGLAAAYRKAMALDTTDEVAAEDYRPYIASHFAPAAFLAAPVWRAGEKIGVLAIQVSIADINRVVTGGRNWRGEGMGRTGQVYLTGPDRKLRSDLREEIEQPRLFYEHLRQAGAAAGTLERIRANGTGILTMEAPEEVRALLAGGQRGTAPGRGFRGVRVLRSYAPVESAVFAWFLVAEIDAEEVQAPVREMYRRVLIWGVGVSGLFLLACWWISRSITRPVPAWARSAALLGEGEFGARVEAKGTEELARLAGSFNRMAESLERTTVSRDRLDEANRQLRGKQGELERLADRLIEAQEEERRRLGRELHDDVTQRVAALAIEAGRLSRQAGGAALERELEEMKERLVRLSREIHGLSRSLHPSSLEDLGLEAAIEAEARAFFERGGPPVELRVEGETASLPPGRRLALYRIAQEALRNIERHAGAQEVEVRLEAREGRVRLEIRDDGRGFDTGARRQGGVGLASMEERARLAGGRLTVESGAGMGTRVVVELEKGEPG
jgi:methyl-accepting chemotaxis protein